MKPTKEQIEKILDAKIWAYCAVAGINEAAQAIVDQWDDDHRQAFIDGAKWWEYYSTKGTMWQSDQQLVGEEAQRRYKSTRPETKPLVKCPKCGKENEPDTAHTCNQGKALTECDILQIMEVECRAHGEVSWESMAKAIHAAPPSESARIKELEADYERQTAAFAELTDISLGQSKTIATLTAENKELTEKMQKASLVFLNFISDELSDVQAIYEIANILNVQPKPDHDHRGWQPK